MTSDLRSPSKEAVTLVPLDRQGLGAPESGWVRAEPLEVVAGGRTYGRGGVLTGRLTGTTRRCRLEGCTGTRLGVRWDDNSLTWPCSKGVRDRSDGALEII